MLIGNEPIRQPLASAQQESLNGGLRRGPEVALLLLINGYQMQEPVAHGCVGDVGAVTPTFLRTIVAIRVGAKPIVGVGAARLLRQANRRMRSAPVEAAIYPRLTPESRSTTTTRRR
jgi:hypothetical protein